MTIEELSEKIALLFNKDFSTLHNKNSQISIKEMNPGASDINVLRIDPNGVSVIEFHTAILDKINHLFLQTNKDEFSLCCGCDGILLSKIDETFHIKFIELKNSFTPSHLKSSLYQFEATNYKIKLVLDFLEGIDCNLNIECLLVSKLPNNYLEKSTMYWKNSLDPSVSLYHNLASNKKSHLCIEKACTALLPVKHKYKFVKIPIKFIEGNNQLISL